MDAYVFMCNWETYDECISRSMLGMGKNFAADIKLGDLCFLYQYDLKKFYGIWRAMSCSDWHEKDAWGGRFKYQVRVHLLSKALLEIPYSHVQHLIEQSGSFIYKLECSRATQILDAFKNAFKSDSDWIALLNNAKNCD